MRRLGTAAEICSGEDQGREDLPGLPGGAPRARTSTAWCSRFPIIGTIAIAREACSSGKDVYLEKPMTYTIEEAAKLNDLVNQTKRILQVGGSGPTTRLYWKVNEYIRAGKMGKILWGLISYNRNTTRACGTTRFPGVGSEAWPNAEFSDKNLRLEDVAGAGAQAAASAPSVTSVGESTGTTPAGNATRPALSSARHHVAP